MKTFSIALIALASISSFSALASQDPCEAPALAAAKKWAREQGLKGHNFQFAYANDDAQGNSVYTYQLFDEHSDGDCWTNIDVTVQEHADDTCTAIKAEENTDAESCS